MATHGWPSHSCCRAFYPSSSLPKKVIASFYVVPVSIKYIHNKYRIETVEMSCICKRVAIANQPSECSIGGATKIQCHVDSCFPLFPWIPLHFGSGFSPLASKLGLYEQRTDISNQSQENYLTSPSRGDPLLS